MILYRLYLSAEERQTLQGWQKKYTSHLPKLQCIQILLNSDEQTGRRRVKVEHAISGAKRLGCVTQVCRNKFLTFNDRVMALACGIWNWHLTKRKGVI